LSLMIGNWLNNWKTATPVNATVTYDQAPAINISDKGRYIFATHCAACHTIGHGDKIGPDLLGITNMRERSWLARFISTPDKVLAEKDPLATALFEKYKQVIMPNLRLAPADLEKLLNFLQTQTTAQHSDSPAGQSGESASKREATELKVRTAGNDR